jgi:hypothetical protein
MRVSLEAKMVPIPRHQAEIDLEWVAEQDQDLVRPGAIFYLTLFKRTKRGSVENAQELRFRRRPAWSSGTTAADRTRRRHAAGEDETAAYHGNDRLWRTASSG